MRVESWGILEGGQIERFTLANCNGIEATIASYGATLTSLVVPDVNGDRRNIVLGYDNLSDYCGSQAYLGATIGRYANRIANGHFVLNGKTYKLTRNEAPNTLHGGFCGFDKKRWFVVDSKPAAKEEAVELSYFSPDGEEGYPGSLNVRVKYLLNDDNELAISYTASCDADTVVNLTNHSYFNLAGSHSGSILDHRLFLNADGYLPVDAGLIPTGEIRRVANSPFDFCVPKLIGRDIENSDEQLSYCGGYDMNWILNRTSPQTLELAARISHEGTGRTMEICTTEPGIQFYSGNQLEGSSAPRAYPYPARSGLCLETQHFPDSPNKPQFPTVVLHAGSIYRSATIFRFSWQPAS
jgi:aldose 1-epimerase